ncbi:hypothetical protein Trydic_g17204 [Trypoxylus dichotomus]
MARLHVADLLAMLMNVLLEDQTISWSRQLYPVRRPLSITRNRSSPFRQWSPSPSGDRHDTTKVKLNPRWHNPCGVSRPIKLTVVLALPLFANTAPRHYNWSLDNRLLSETVEAIPGSMPLRIQEALKKSKLEARFPDAKILSKEIINIIKQRKRIRKEFQQTRVPIVLKKDRNPISEIQHSPKRYPIDQEKTKTFAAHFSPSCRNDPEQESVLKGTVDKIDEMETVPSDSYPIQTQTQPKDGHNLVQGLYSPNLNLRQRRVDPDRSLTPGTSYTRVKPLPAVSTPCLIHHHARCTEFLDKLNRKFF